MPGDTRKLLLLAASAALVAGIVKAQAKHERDLKVVPSVDLSRYAGTWYEIARLPNRFQRDCASDTTATYTLRPDGKMGVLNRCRAQNGQVKSAKGTARAAGGSGPNTKLKVTFFWPFSGDYWIVELDPEYRWAVVGEPGRNYLWILSRTPRMDPAVYETLLARIREHGFDAARLLKTPHTAA